MQYLLTQAEKDALGGDRKKLEEEVRAEMKQKINAFTDEVYRLIKENRADPYQFRRNPDVDLMLQALNQAMAKVFEAAPPKDK